MSIGDAMEALGIRLQIHRLLLSPDCDLNEVDRLERMATEIETAGRIEVS